MDRKDFSEIDHTGGKVTFNIVHDEIGRISYQIGYSGSSPNPMSLVGVYAHKDGFACGGIVLGGIGMPFNEPPLPNCIPIFMASDSQGKFGHECPSCNKHFRSNSIPAKSPLTCPYCGLRAEAYHFLTPPQNSYIRHYIDTLFSGINESELCSTNKKIINMDDVADSVTDEPRPDFYYTSIAQQTEFNCTNCNSYNDIRGRYGYCSSCGYRNSAESQKTALEKIRESLNTRVLSPAEVIKQATSEFDAAARDLTNQLVSHVPMKESRVKILKKLLFHNLEKIDKSLNECFGINILKGMKSDNSFVAMMFFRRHVYEHDGGVATERYVRESGDTKIEEGDLIRETLDNANRFISCLNRMISNFDVDFHEILKPLETKTDKHL